jgi:hypothetical protein
MKKKSDQKVKKSPKIKAVGKPQRPMAVVTKKVTHDGRIVTKRYSG